MQPNPDLTVNGSGRPQQLHKQLITVITENSLSENHDQLLRKVQAENRPKVIIEMYDF